MLAVLSAIFTGVTAAAENGEDAIRFTVKTNYEDALKVTTMGAEEKSVIMTEKSRDFEVMPNQWDYVYVTIEAQGNYAMESASKKDGSLSVYSNKTSVRLMAKDNGEVINVGLRDMEATRTATCTVNVDDPSKVSVAMYNPSIGSIAIPLEKGLNTVKFDPENEKKLTIKSYDSMTPVYSVKFNGVDVNADNIGFTAYTLNMIEGCNVDITALIPADPITLTFEYGDDGALAIESVKVNDEDRALTGSNLELTAGDKLTLTAKEDYCIDEARMGDNIFYLYSGQQTSFYVLRSESLYIKAHQYPTLTFKIKVSTPGEVAVSCNGTDYILCQGEHTIQALNNNGSVYTSRRKVYGSELNSPVIINGVETEDSFANLDADAVLEFAPDAVVMDKRYVLWVDNVDIADYRFNINTSSNIQYPGKLVNGYNEIRFCDAYNPFEIGAYSSQELVKRLFVNGEEQTQNYGSFSLEFADNDVAKLFLSGMPVVCNLEYQMASDLDVTVIHDLVAEQEELGSPFQVFAGTDVKIINNSTDKVTVSVNGSNLDENEKSYNFTVNEPETVVKISNSAPAGLSFADAENDNEIFNLHGLEMTCKRTDLPAGIYISDGKKIVVK